MKKSQDFGKKAWTAAVGFYLVIAVPLVLVLWVLHSADAYTERRQWSARQMASLRVASDALLVPLREAANDLSLLVEQAADDIGGQEGDEALVRQFVRFVRHRRIYDQLRFIGLDGHERVRVNYRDGEARIVPREQLSDKAHRPYFVKGIRLARGDVYVSRFDLNVENRQIETPHRPTLRFVQPVFDAHDSKLGLLVLNLDGQAILDILAVRDRNSDLGYWLINAEGYWLYSDDPSAAWGFQLSGERTIAEVDGLADILARPRGGLVETLAGQFAFNRIKLSSHSTLPLLSGDETRNILSEEPYWILLTVVKPDRLYSSSQRRLQVMVAVSGIALLALIPAAGFWGQWRSRADHERWRAQIYAQVIEQSDELVYVTTPDATILFANPAVERFTGYSREEIIGSTPRLFKSNRQTEGFYSTLWEKVRARQTVRTVLVNRRKDGSLFYENKIISPLIDASGRVTHLVSIGRDISAEQHRQEREMRLADQLSAQLSHHFNNLLAPIINYAEMAADTAQENAQPGIRDDIEKILVGANRLRDVLGKISAMSLDAQLSQGVQAVGPVVRGIARIEQTTLPKTIDLVVELDDSMDAVGVEFDDLALVLSEVINNARDAVEGAGTISMAATMVTLGGEVACSACGTPMSGEYVDISVSDDGRGMSSVELSHAFDPFYSTKQSSKLVGETLGIGLSRVRNRVHACGGHVRIVSERGSGTTVHILCPARKLDAGEREREERAPETV